MALTQNRATRFKYEGKELRARPEELPPFTFNPSDHLIDATVSEEVANIPRNGKYILRWTMDRWFGSAVPDLASRIAITNTHFNQLEELGIRIPFHRHIAIGKAPVADSVAIYTAVEKLEITPWESVPNSNQFIREHIDEPLAEYHDWVRSTNQPYELSDIGRHTQFVAVQRRTSEEYDAYLLDLEGVLTPSIQFNHY